MPGGRARTLGLLTLALLACAPDSTPAPDTPGDTPATRALPDEPSPTYRHVETPTAYVGDGPCVGCHQEAAAAYREHAMARSFHPWTPGTRIEPTLDEPLRHPRTGFHYAVVEDDGALFQEETLLGPGGRRLHELRRRIDFVMGSGEVARTYFTEENGRLFQLPLTWYREGGWDFSPGYELDNARFGRLLPDRCLACHGSYPEPMPFLEGKYAELRPGIGCERCHGPGELHVRERRAGETPDGAYDATIVDPARLPLARRLDVCEQCHVHTPVTVLRESRDAFDYLPSERLEDHAAFFRASGSIDIVSHADRLRQSACVLVTLGGDRPLECTTCHDPHAPVADGGARRAPCLECHAPATLERRLAGSAALADHDPAADCAGCHMPRASERTVPHGSFTDHWIRVVDAPSRAGRAAPGDAPIEPYFERDRTGPEAAIYRGMGEVVYATLATDAGLLARGAEALGRALGSDTTHGDARFLLGLAYRQLGRTVDAIPALEAAVRAEPGNPQRLHALARAYESAGRDTAVISSLYGRALEVQPAVAWIRADYADFLRSSGRVEEAETAYRAALAERPGLAVAAFDLATLLVSEGRLAEAAEEFTRAVRLDPSIAEALATLLQVHTRAGVVASLRLLGSPLPSLPVRDRGPGAARLAPASGPRPGVRFLNVPPAASVRILEGDGELVRELGPGEGSGATRAWDLGDGAGRPIRGGLYEVQVREPREPGQPPRAPQRFFFGIVRSDAP